MANELHQQRLLESGQRRDLVGATAAPPPALGPPPAPPQRSGKKRRPALTEAEKQWRAEPGRMADFALELRDRFGDAPFTAEELRRMVERHMALTGHGTILWANLAGITSRVPYLVPHHKQFRITCKAPEDLQLLQAQSKRYWRQQGKPQRPDRGPSQPAETPPAPTAENTAQPATLTVSTTQQIAAAVAPAALSPTRATAVVCQLQEIGREVGPDLLRTMAGDVATWLSREAAREGVGHVL